MAWEVVKIDNSKICRGKPTASVGRNKITLNVAACDLIDNYESYKYVEFLKDTSDSTKIGIRFLMEPSADSVVIKRRQANGKTVGGIDVSSKCHMEKLFGNKGTHDGTTHYDIVKDQDADDTLIVIVKG